ncbi:MAG: DUF6531 domain-containing protein, partial [Gammaproteobacteria bacterium]|nr:DUF6531 domain-containing protein [Gammaproteobacteria bacterium]
MLKLAGVEQSGFFSGAAAVGLCSTDNNLNLNIRVSNSSGEASVNSVSYSNIGAANYHALQAFGFQASDRLIHARVNQLKANVLATSNPNTDPDATLGEYLNIVGLKYMRYTSDASKYIGQLAGQSGESGNHIGLASTSSRVRYLFGLPLSVSAQSLLVDMPGLNSRSADLVTGDSNWENFLLAGYAGSAYEHYVWQENARLDAVSTVRGMQYANETGTPLVTINYSNWATTSALLVESASCGTTLDYCPGFVENLRTQYFLADDGWQLRIPQSRIQFQNWKGTVYVAERQAAGSFQAGYIISGEYAGGYVVGDYNSGGFDSFLDTGYNNYTPLADPGTSSGSGLTSGESYNALANDINSYINSPSGAVTAGDPVNMVTGNMYHTEKDIKIKGRGIPIVFERTYNTKNAGIDGPLGFGWTHTYSHAITFNDGNTDGVWNAVDEDGITSSITWTDDKGNRKYIDVSGANASGIPSGATFTTPAGFKFSVTKDGANVIRITEPSGFSYIFEAVSGVLTDTAKLSRVEDVFGNGLDITYVSNRIDQIIDDLGRSLTFGYVAGTDYIETIEDWAGRVHTYGYDGSSNLVSYSNPRASQLLDEPVTYTYYSTVDGENLGHFMRSYQYARGNGVTFEYYLDGRVFRHYNDLGHTMHFSFNDFRRESITVNERGLT